MIGSTAEPTIIQGGMGVAVSNWRLANAVARQGQLGVVSATALDTVLVRRLQDGDADGAMRRSMADIWSRSARILTSEDIRPRWARARGSREFPAPVHR